MPPTPFTLPPISPEYHPAAAPRSVLLVDDDRGWLCALSRLMEREGFEVETATNAIAALRALKEKPVHLIVSDIDMPRMDGLELRHALISNSDSGAIPFIFVSGARDEENLAAAESLGVAHFLEKTGPVLELMQLARRLAG